MLFTSPLANPCFRKIYLINNLHYQDPHSWLVGSDVVVVDPPRKGLDRSLVDTLRTISSMKPKSKTNSSER